MTAVKNSSIIEVKSTINMGKTRFNFLSSKVKSNFSF